MIFFWLGTCVGIINQANTCLLSSGLEQHKINIRSSSLVLFEFQLRLRSLFARPSMGLILWQKDINSGHTLELLKRPTVIFLCLGFFLEITMLPFHPLNTLRLLFL